MAQAVRRRFTPAERKVIESGRFIAEWRNGPKWYPAAPTSGILTDKSDGSQYMMATHDGPTTRTISHGAVITLVPGTGTRFSEEWPAGKAFGELTPLQKQAAARRAGTALAAELTANAGQIGAILDNPPAG
jgi:hypothetical protein